MIGSRAAAILYIGNFAQAFGLQLFSPILPLFLSTRNFGTGHIGIVVSAGILGYGLGQFPAGLFSEHFDRRNIIVSSLLLYGVLFFVYVIPMSFYIIVAFRFIHASMAAVFSVASLALLSEAIPPALAGRAFSQWQALAQLGFVLGPMMGGFVAAVDPVWDFVICGFGYIALSLVMLCLPRPKTRRNRHRFAFPSPPNTVGDTFGVTIVSLIRITGSGDFTLGLLTAVGSIWVLSLDGDAVAVGVFFGCLALPTVVFARIVGRFIDAGRIRVLLFFCLTLLVVAGFYAGAITTTAGALIVAIVIGVGVAPLRPLAFSSLTKSHPSPVGLGRLQGRLQGGLMLIQFAAAAIGGFTLERSHSLTFGCISACATVSVIFAIREGARLARSG